MMRIAVSIALLAGRSVRAVTSRDQSGLVPLKFNRDGTFQISVFSDLHFAQDASGTGPEQDRASVKVISDILDFDPPDLVILNGDLINGEDTYLENSTHYIDQIVAPMVERKLTWASSYGNHDHNYNISGNGILEREQQWPGSRTDRMVDAPNAGVTNYYLPIYASNCAAGSTDCAPELLLWFFDSRGGSYYQGNAQPNWVDSSVVAWFNETNSALVEQYGKEIPSLAFVHVPVHATHLIQEQGSVHHNYQPGINEEEVVQQGDGWCDETSRGCDYGDQDLPFMRALVSTPGIIGLFYGHDHANSWCYKWDSQLPGMDIAGNGINLCYGQHSGYGGYGDYIRGARQIIVTAAGLKDHAVDSHIRLESGEIVGKISLNSTFNTDYYEATRNQKTYLGRPVTVISSAQPRATYSLHFIMSLASILCLRM